MPIVKNRTLTTNNTINYQKLREEILSLSQMLGNDINLSRTRDDKTINLFSRNVDISTLDNSIIQQYADVLQTHDNTLLTERQFSETEFRTKINNDTVAVKDLARYMNVIDTIDVILSNNPSLAELNTLYNSLHSYLSNHSRVETHILSLYSLEALALGVANLPDPVTDATNQQKALFIRLCRKVAYEKYFEGVFVLQG